MAVEFKEGDHIEYVGDIFPREKGVVGASWKWGETLIEIHFDSGSREYCTPYNLRLITPRNIKWL